MTRTIGALFCAIAFVGCGFGSDAPQGAARGTTASSTSSSPALAPTSTASPTPTEDSLAFAVLGDWGSRLPAQFEVARRMCRYRERHPYDLVLTTGDNVYPDGDPALFDETLEPYGCLFDSGVRFHASLGNHDIKTQGGERQIQDARFGMSGRNYVESAGGVRFVVADSNALDRDWLRSALSPEEGDRWTVVVFHHPVFSSGSEHGSTPGYRPSLPRLFARRGVDLVLNGHDHDYEVTKPIRRIRYVVTGGGGASVRPCGPRMNFTAICAARPHFLYIEAADDGLRVRAVPPAGRPFHSFSTAGRP